MWRVFHLSRLVHSKLVRGAVAIFLKMFVEAGEILVSELKAYFRYVMICIHQQVLGFFNSQLFQVFVW